MKRLSGGLVLLNLTAISLGLTSGEVNITDTGILEELTELRQFIDVNRDFSKGFKNLKPILIEYRSNASKFNGITQANLSFNTDALHMSIGANTIQADGKLLVITINVVYEYTDYVGYTIKSAKLIAYKTLASGDGTFTGDVGVGGDLEVTGNAILPEINGEENPSVKPLYYHGIEMYNSQGSVAFVITFAIINNSATPLTWETLKDWIESVGTDVLINSNGFYNVESTGIVNLISLSYQSATGKLYIGGNNTSCEYINSEKLLDDWDSVFDSSVCTFNDKVNKLN